MSRTFECGETAALVSYQYGECEPAEHAVVAAHLRVCPACAAEVEALEATRRQLAAWAPPELDAGIRVTIEPPDPVLRPARWWRRALPVWAQAAAAVVLFAGGLSMGGAASVWLAPEAAEAVAPPMVSATDLAELERPARGGDCRRALRTADVVRDFDAQRRVDLAQVDRAVGELQGLTGAEVAAQRQLLDYLIRVSQQR